MFGSLFNSVASVATTAARVVVAPVAVVANVADVVTKPIGHAAEAVQKEVASLLK